MLRGLIEMRKRYPDLSEPVRVPPKEPNDWIVLRILIPLYLKIPGYLKIPALRIFGMMGTRFR